MKIIWTELAVSRLENVVDFISIDNPDAAEKFAIKIFTKVEKLVEQPEMGRKIKELNRKDVREILEGNYRIIYRIEERQISILTVRHGKQILPVDEIIELGK